MVTGIGSLLSHSLDLPVLPQHGAPWSLGALVLLGPLGLSALPWYGACALLAASLHGCKRPTIAVMVLVAYIVLVALGALVAGMECHRIPHIEPITTFCSWSILMYFGYIFGPHGWQRR